MILECTHCRTRYLVPDTAIGAAGRTVRCASCKHSWFQAPPEALDLVARAQEPAAPAAMPVASMPQPVAEPASQPTGEPLSAPAIQSPEPQTYDAFAHRPPFRPRRNPARRWTMAALAAGIAMLAGVGAILYTGAPGIASQLGLPIGASATPLTLVTSPIERRDLANGSEVFMVSGKVVNPTGTRQAVPKILAVLRDAHGRPVYSWTISPDANALPPRGQVAFNSATIDVPVNATELKLSFSGEAAR